MKQTTAKQRRALEINRRLKQLFPDAHCALHYNGPWELLVAVMLSAQCTDKKVNEVTAKLFKKYPSFADYLSADPKEFEQDIFSTGFYRAKAKHILATAQRIHTEFHDMVPQSMKELVALPGVARKTANVVLGNAYGVVEGIAVDTHVMRLSAVLGLTKHHDPVKIEQDLMKLLPRSEWLSFTYRLIEYGRTYCSAKKHNHAQCPLSMMTL